MKYFLAAVVILALIGGGVWWYISKESNKGYAVVLDRPTATEIFKPGDKSALVWHTYNFRNIDPNWIKNVTVRVSMIDSTQTPEEARMSGDKVVVDDFAFTEQGSIPFTIPQDMKPGTYQLKMSLFGSGNQTPNPLWGLEYRTNGAFTITL